MNSDPSTDLKTFQLSAWASQITNNVVYTVPIDKANWRWIQADRFWQQDINKDIKLWIADQQILAKQGKFKVTRTKNHPTKGRITNDYHEPVIHFLDRRQAIACRLRWGNEVDPVKIQSINTIGTLPAPGRLFLHKEAVKELSRLKKLIEKYGYNLPTE